MSLSPELLAIFVPAAALVAATPGANNLLSLINGLHAGFAPTLASLFGRMAAFAILLILVALGLGALLERSWLAFVIVKWCGVAYLAYLGVKLWRTRTPPTGTTAMVRGTWSLARREFVVAITNPKAILLFTAFIPQFVTPGAATIELFELGAVYLLVEFAMASGYALAGAMMRRFELTPGRSRLINRVSGGMMLSAAGLLALTRRST